MVYLKGSNDGFPDGSVVKKLPVMQEMWVESLDWDNFLEEVQQPTPVFLPEEFHGQRAWWDGVYGVAELCVGHN